VTVRAHMTTPNHERDRGSFWQGARARRVMFIPWRSLLLGCRMSLTSPRPLHPAPNPYSHWDASKLASTTAAAARIDAVTDRVDGALITTGLGFHGNLTDMSLEASDKVLQRLMQVNTIGPSLLSQYCAAKMRVAAAAPNAATPTLLLLSSYSGVVGLPHRAAYCASKFALNGYIESVVRMWRSCPARAPPR
jgi:NAD(P)-dependent dehydrogenase (short-subunit alcohol dehydrogenase family)